MVRAALKGLLANKLRLTLTAIAIVLGVAFVAGSFVFTDTINARFATLLTDVSVGVDVYVRPEPPEFGDVFQNTEAQSMPEGILETVRAVDGVRAADGTVAGFAQVVGKDGEPIGGQGPPTLGFSWGSEPSLSPVQIMEGNGGPPTAAGEVVIDANTMKEGDFALGDRVQILLIGAPEEFEIVGFASFGDEDSLAGATLAIFEHDEAQRIFDLEGRLSEVAAAADEGVTPADLAERIEAEVDSGLLVQTAEEANADQLSQISEGLGFLNIALLAFAAVAVFVGAFIITNTFRIIVAQRTRELALLRAIGATARQVTWMVVLEALVVAIIASAVGIAAGVLLAIGLNEVSDALGFGVPDGPLTLLPRTIVVGMLTGVIVTVVAAVLPARHASRIPPVAAMSEQLSPPRRKDLRNRAIAGLVVSGLGLAALAVGLLASVSNAIAYVGAGALIFFLGISILAPLAAGPVATVLGWPLPKMFGVTGSLAQENTRRQPRRMASTASALMIGVALVVFVAIFGSSIKASVEETIFDAFPADFQASSTNFTVGISRSFTESLGELPEIDTVSAVRFGTARIEGSAVSVNAVDPATIGEVVDVEPSEGAYEQLAASNGILVSSDQLESQGWSIGDTIDIEYPLDPGGPIEIVGSFGNAQLGHYVITHETYEQGFSNPFDNFVAANIAEGVEFAAARSAVDDLTTEYPNVQVQTKDEAVADAEAQIDALLALFTVLLFLAIIIAMLGIANTLALSILERTREIGLLRAVGMVRRQVRRMVRWEAVIIALFGAVLGIGIGLFLGWAVVAALGEEGLGTFSVPWDQLILMLILAAAAGMLASIWPSYKASNLKILEAIAYE
jgi:putative ABC transport system permease protein